MRRVFQAAGGACADGRTDVQELAGGGWCRVAAVTTVSITAATEVSAQGTSCQRHCGGRGRQCERNFGDEGTPAAAGCVAGVRPPPPHKPSAQCGLGAFRKRFASGQRGPHRGPGVRAGGKAIIEMRPVNFGSFRPHRTQAGPRSPRHADGSQGLQRGLTGLGPRPPARPGALGVLLSPEAPRVPLLPEARQKSPGLLSSPKSL